MSNDSGGTFPSAIGVCGIIKFNQTPRVVEHGTNNTRKRVHIQANNSRARIARAAFFKALVLLASITNSKLRQAARKIADCVQPEKIILFGSYAYGQPNDDSDVDLFVLMESNKSIHARM